MNNIIIRYKYKYNDIGFSSKNSKLSKKYFLNVSAAQIIENEKNIFIYVDNRYYLNAKNNIPKVIDNKDVIILNSSYFYQNILNSNNDDSYVINPYLISINEYNILKTANIKYDFNAHEEQISYCDNVDVIENWDFTKSYDIELNKIANKANINANEACFIGMSYEIAWAANIRIKQSISNANILPCYGLVYKVNDELCISIYSQLKIKSRINNNNNKNIIFKDINQLESDIKSFKKIKSLNTSPYAIKLLANELEVIESIGFDNHISNEINYKKISIACSIDSYIKSKLIGFLKDKYEKKEQISEQSIQDKIKSLNLSFPEYVSNSFDTIAAINENSANPHAEITDNQISYKREYNVILIDSGSQYIYGTTDSTRTICLGNPCEDLIKCYTTVLKAHISPFLEKWGINAKYSDIDNIVRNHISSAGFNLPHSTGHGIMQYGHVHDGVINVSKNNNSNIELGAVITIEPGIYIENKYGIRIENMCVIKMDTDGKIYLEPLTFIPFDMSLVNKNLLTSNEIHWINEYNNKIKLIYHNIDINISNMISMI